MKLDITITTESPLIITSKIGDNNMISTLDYINGTSLHGLFANLWLNKNAADDEFYKLFFSNKGFIFRNAYPFVNNTIAFPQSSSIQVLKNKKGIAYEMFNEDNKALKKEQKKSISELCYIKDEKDEKNESSEVPQTIVKSEVQKTIFFHSERDPEKGQSKDGLIFNYQSIDPFQTFKGTILGNKAELENLKELIEDKSYYLGRSKTAQYGKVKIEISEIKNYEINKQDMPSENIVMVFLSDTIIYNEFGKSSTYKEDIAKYLNVAISEAYIKKATTENFVSVWMCRKPTEEVIVAGSSFKLDKLPEKPENFLLKGLGERTNEGFGQIKFYSAKDNQKFEVVKLSDFESKPTAENVAVDLNVIKPELSKKILISAITENINNKLITKAFENANAFNLDHNSLISRLSDLANDIVSFKDNIEKLADTAKNK